jgi:hypothetical protein
MESAGVQDVLTKIVGSRNPFNVVRATFDAIASLMTTDQVRRLRGIDVASAAAEVTAKEEPPDEAAAAQEATQELKEQEAEAS